MVVVEVLVIVVLVAARGCDRRAGAVVGVDGGRIVGSRGRYRDALLGSAREPGLRGALVAACEDGQAAFDRAVGRSGVMQEVVEGVLLQRGVRRPLLFVLEARRPPLVAVGAARDIAPAALQDDGAVVGRVLDGPDGRSELLTALPENIWQLMIFTPGMSAFPPAVELMPMPLLFCAAITPATCVP